MLSPWLTALVHEWRPRLPVRHSWFICGLTTKLSNVQHLKDLPSPKPAVNQIEVHPWMQQRPITEYCLENGIRVMAFCPLVRAKAERVNDPVVVRIGEMYGKNWAQVILRWSLQTGYV